jgi:vancomycin aglycone glucosyltransferase
MRVVWSAMKFRGDVEPAVGFTVRLRAAGAPVRVCASSDEPVTTRLSGVGVSPAPVGASH